LELLEPYSKDLIALSGTQGGTSGQRLGHLKDVFNDRLYQTLQDPSVGLPLSSLSRRMKIPMVVTHPIYYLTSDQANLQRTLTAIRFNKPIEQLSSNELAPPGAYFTSQVEMQRRFSGFQPALERTQEIAERCRFDLPLGVANMPKVPLPDGITQSQYLRQKAEAGATVVWQDHPRHSGAPGSRTGNHRPHGLRTDLPNRGRRAWIHMDIYYLGCSKKLPILSTV